MNVRLVHIAALKTLWQVLLGKEVAATVGVTFDCHVEMTGLRVRREILSPWAFHKKQTNFSDDLRFISYLFGVFVFPRL